MTSQSWRMWAGERTNHTESAPVFCDLGDHPMYTKMHGHARPIAVTVTEAPEGRYWGWLGNTNRNRDTEPPVYEDFPTMIHEHEGIFNMCFAYGYKVEVDHNAGRVVRLDITRDPDDTTTSA